MSFERDGAAAKTIELKRYDKTGGKMLTIEKSVRTAKIGDAQFKAFAEAVVNDEFGIAVARGATR